MATRPPFHEQLRYERELRGWSQADLARKVRCDTKTVGRWENGESYPRPYHRQVLCEVLGKNAEELGLLRENEKGHSDRKVILSSAEHTQPLSEDEEQLSRLLAALRDPTKPPAFIIYGLHGQGKTAFALERARRSLQHPVQEGLLTVDDPTERAAIIAESIINTLPEEIALIARQCALFHWFDQSLVEALLQSTPFTHNDTREVYKRIISLPFIESLAWGVTFHRLTREGLLQRYSTSRSEMLMTAARLAAPEYSARVEDRSSRTEAFFCYLVAGNSESASALLDLLLEQAASGGNWQYISGLKLLLDEAERFSFVKSFQPSERQWIIQGLAHRVQGELDAALLDYTHALEINPQNALCYLIRGTIYSEQERYEEALADYEQAHNLDSANVQVYINLGVVYFVQRDYEAAFRSFQLALGIDPANEVAREYTERILGIKSPEIATILLRLAASHVRAGNYILALPLYRQALAIQEQVLGAEHLEVATNLYNPANLESDQGQLAEAKALVQHAITIGENTLGSEHPELASWLNNLAALYVEQGKDRQAQQLYQRALAIQEKVLGPGHPEVIESMNNLAALSRRQGLYEQAEKLHLRVLAIREKALGTEHPDIVESLFNLALDYHDQDKDTEAEVLYQRALTILEKGGEKESFLAAAIHNNLAVIYDLQGRYEQAEPLFQRAITIAQAADLSVPLVTLLSNLGSLHLEQDRYAEAEPLFLQALNISRSQFGTHHSTARILANLAKIYSLQGIYSEAERYFLWALEIYEATLGPADIHTVNVLEDYAKLLRQIERDAEAQQIEARVRQIKESTREEPS